MMHGLKSGISFCFVDDHPLFLDIPNDRYLTLPPVEAALFRDWLTARFDGQAPELPGELIKTDLFDQSKKLSQPCPAFEARREAQPLTPSALTTSRLAAELIHQRIKMNTLGRRLARLEGALLRHAHATAVDAEHIIGRCAADLQLCRRLLSATDQCLADGLAITRHLRQQDVHARLIFGVRLPFAAHCWVQVGDIVVGDTLERIRPFTPIHMV